MMPTVAQSFRRLSGPGCPGNRSLRVSVDDVNLNDCTHTYTYMNLKYYIYICILYYHNSYGFLCEVMQDFYHQQSRGFAMGPFASGGVCSMGPHFVYGL